MARTVSGEIFKKFLDDDVYWEETQGRDGIWVEESLVCINGVDTEEWSSDTLKPDDKVQIVAGHMNSRGDYKVDGMTFSAFFTRWLKAQSSSRVVAEVAGGEAKAALTQTLKAYKGAKALAGISGYAYRAYHTSKDPAFWGAIGDAWLEDTAININGTSFAGPEWSIEKVQATDIIKVEEGYVENLKDAKGNLVDVSSAAHYSRWAKAQPTEWVVVEYDHTKEGALEALRTALGPGVTLHG